MDRKRNLKNIMKYIILNIFILSIIYILYIKNIRICLIYNLFKIPGSGCGLTTSVMCLIKGDILKSLQYNIMTIPLIIIYTVCSCWYIVDMIRNKQTLKEIVNKNKKKIIVISIIIFVISFIRNITNPLLY